LKFTAIDDRAGAETGHGLAVGILCRPFELDVECHRLGNAADGEIAVDEILVAAASDDVGALEGDLRVVGGIEEVVGAKVIVAIGVSRVDAGHVDLPFKRRLGEIAGVETDLAVELSKLTANRRHHHVFDGKADMAVNAVDDERHGGSPSVFSDTTE
jgi:hypothetical protein